jgi:hypothetical protein
MNTKVGNVIAVELGILIVILAWLAFSNFSRVKQRAPAEEQEPADSSFATITSLPLPANPRRYAADYFTAQQRQQLAAQQQAQTLQYETMQYDQQLAPAPDTNGEAYDSVTSGTSPYDVGVYPEPVTSPDSFAWPYDPVLVYPPTSEIIVISNARAFARRQAPRFARPRMTIVHRRPLRDGGAQFHSHSRAVKPRSTANPRSFRPSAGSRLR